MSLFPSLNYRYPFKVTQVFSTLTHDFDGGGEQRRAKWGFPKFDVAINLKGLLLADSQTMFQFYMERKGRLESFYIYDEKIYTFKGLYIGTGDDSTVTFDIPGNSTNTHTIYSNGVEVSSDDYTIVTGGGTEESDRVTFDTAPTLGNTLSCDFTGYLRMHVRFKDDDLTREDFIPTATSYTIDLKGLK